MRTLFLILVFANVVFLAWRYYDEHFPSRGADPFAQQLHPEKVKLVAPEELARMTAAPRQATCVELGPVATGDAARAEEAVSGIAAGLKVAQRRVEPCRKQIRVTAESLDDVADLVATSLRRVLLVFTQ